MSGTALVARVAAMEVRALLRRILQDTVGDLVPARVAGPAVLVLLTGGTVLLTFQALDVGRALGSGFGPGLVAGLFSAAATALAMTALIGTHVWSRVTADERLRLAILPLGRRALTVVATVPALVPTAVGLYVSLPSLVVLTLTTQVGLATVVGSLALGFAVPLALAALWTVPLLVVRPRRDLVVVGLVALSLAGLLLHAVRRAGAGDAGIDAGGNPVLWVLTKTDRYTAGEALLSTLALVVSGAAVVGLRHLRARQRPRRARVQRASTGRPSRVPPAPRVWAGLVRIVWRQSSLVSEIGVAAVLGAVVCLVAAVLLVQDRFTHGYTALLIASGFGALPLLGLHSALGPTYRLTQLGVRPVDIRFGLAGAGLVFHTVSLLPGVVVLVWRGGTPVDVVVFAALSAVTFGIVLSVGSALRRVAGTSLGRSLGVALVMPPFFLLIRLGVPSWPLPAVLAAAVAALAVLTATLTLTVRRTSTV